MIHFAQVKSNESKPTNKELSGLPRKVSVPYKRDQPRAFHVILSLYCHDSDDAYLKLFNVLSPTLSNPDCELYCTSGLDH